MDFATAIESFPWESKEQKEGYLALVQYLRGFGIEPSLPIDSKSAFFIQKDIDANAYWRELVGGQVSNLQDEIVSVREQLDEALRLVNQMEMTIKAQSSAIEALTVCLGRYKINA